MFSEKRKGDISEVQVCYFLLEQGYGLETYLVWDLQILWLYILKQKRNY